MDAQATAYGVGIGLGLSFGANVFTVLIYMLFCSVIKLVKARKQSNDIIPKGVSCRGSKPP